MSLSPLSSFFPCLRVLLSQCFYFPTYFLNVTFPTLSLLSMSITSLIFTISHPLATLTISQESTSLAVLSPIYFSLTLFSIPRISRSLKTRFFSLSLFIFPTRPHFLHLCPNFSPHLPLFFSQIPDPKHPLTSKCHSPFRFLDIVVLHAPEVDLVTSTSPQYHHRHQVL